MPALALSKLRLLVAPSIVAVALTWVAAAAPTTAGSQAAFVTRQASPGPVDPQWPVDQPCFGAAAVDPQHPCDNPGLALTVFPKPANARAAQFGPMCEHRERSVDGLLDVCFFGVPAARATRTVALLGDSHAAHWRVALDAVVTAHRWRAISIHRAGCPLTLAHPDLPGIERQTGCMDWNRAVQHWMAAHPEIDVVFTSQHHGAALPTASLSAGAARRAGYIAGWNSLLSRHVRQIVIIRDTPRIAGTTLACIEDAVAAQLPPGQECALKSSFALRRDPAVDAARALDSPQVQVADLGTFFCRKRMCPPVTGGALVLRDTSHMTTVYGRTLGPYLLARVNALMASWPAPTGAPAGR